MQRLIVITLTALLWQSHGQSALKHYVYDGCHEQYDFHNGTTRAAALGGNDVASVRCCSKTLPLQCETDVNTLCNSGKTFDEAKAICEGAPGDWRLCTLTELQSGVCCGTGCDYDYMTNIWTSTPAQPKVIRSPCDPSGGNKRNFSLAAATTFAIALCFEQDTKIFQKCDPKRMGYWNAVDCCANLPGNWEVAKSDDFTSDPEPCVTGPTGLQKHEHVWISDSPVHAPYVATDGCKIRNYGSLARSAGGKDYYYNTFEKHAVRCCSFDGGHCETATRLGCESAVSWYEAQEACSEKGMRLCTLAEMDDDKCCVTGCMFDVDKVWTSSSVRHYRLAQKNETGDSCNYKADVSTTSAGDYGVVCCGDDSSCIDPVPGTCTKKTVEHAAATCEALGLEICRDSRLCSRCKATKCYVDGEYIVTTKTYVS